MKGEDAVSLTPLIDLAHHRWNIPIVAELHRRSGAKFITLANCLSASRGSLCASISDLIEQGLVMRNPGHGHPMRPEYLLTPSGEAIGEQCLRLARLVERRNEADLAYRKWTLPLVAAIGAQAKRFNELRTLLGRSATPRAVTLGLKAMQSAGWAERSIIDAYPPAAGYALRPTGRRVLAVVDGLLD
ncbi:MAG: winged helix-turn-helix transcriptional regulator [Pseudomonadota bacterium]